MGETDIDVLRQRILDKFQEEPTFGPMGLNRHQRRSLRAKLDQIHQQRQKVQTEIASRPKPLRKNKVLQALEDLQKALA